MTDKTGKFCTRCGAPAQPDSAFCQECGNPIEGVDSTYTNRPGYVPPTFNGYYQNVVVFQAERRLKFVKILSVVYLLLGLFMAFFGIFIDTFIDAISQNPDMMASLGTEMYDELVASAGLIYRSGVIFAVSSLLVLGSLILSIMKKYHMVAVLLCAIGSLILFLMSDGLLLAPIGLIVTYLLFTSKQAFTS